MSNSSNSSTIVLAEGNTKPPPAQKQCSPAMHWCFTWNNYPDSADSSISSISNMVNGGIYGRERGEEGTPHLQGYISFHKKARPTSLKLPKQIHWTAAKGSLDHNIDYCGKGEQPKEEWELLGTKGPNYGKNAVMVKWGSCKKEKKINMEITDEDVIPYKDLFPWGRDLVNRVSGGLPLKTDRTITWIWSRQGQMKKTETARYLCHHHDAVVIQGGRRHVLATAYKNPAPIYILIVPRTDEGFVSYASIELLKDSLYMSGFGTEATGMVNRKKPWVLVMANFAPDKETMSADRWQVLNVDI